MIGEANTLDERDAELIEKVENLKKERHAVILAHNFQLGEVQDSADFVGDTLELLRQAIETEAEVIVFGAVHFLAESAAALLPEKTILLPDKDAFCPMAHMITADRLRALKAEHPDAVVVCYLNTPAEVKAESDICCTADNAEKIIGGIPTDKEVMFVPDQYLGDYISSRLGRELILYPGFCSPHIKIRGEDITALKKEHPDAAVVAHMESSPLVKIKADAVLSSGGIVEFARQTEAREIIVATETGILHRLRKENPEKTFIAASDQATCAKMKLITLEKILWSLETITERITVPEEIRQKVKTPLVRMLEA